MREIIFRAWDEGNKVMHTNVEFIQSGKYSNDWICISSDQSHYKVYGNQIIFDNPYLRPQIHLMQFTGLHDRNGKEIYADDILKDSVGHLFRVYACICGFAIKAEYWRNDLSDLIIGDELILTSLIDAQMQSYVSGSVEIIGNRFENPELM